MHLHDRTILVTGATSGIGRALSLQLAAHGNHVVAVGRDADKLSALQHELPNATTMRCDLTSKTSVIELALRIEAEQLPVSVLINNAAVQFTPRFTDDDFSFDGIEAEITTNFTAVAWLTALLLPRLLEHNNGSAIVNLSSGLAFYPKPSSALYCASKAALHSLSQALRYQLDGTNVRVSEVLLPLVDTPMTEGRGTNKLTPEFTAQKIIQGVARDVDEIYIGKARILPILNRISPALTRRILRNV
ncbi:SDR family oxidoreductase [Magnetovibrio sp.]|uniref:SDR family oxidoreductase n=1 Tax=Magnetovibrio sp. TaxID=2024836 RepID=UPI002F92E465